MKQIILAISLTLLTTLANSQAIIRPNMPYQNLDPNPGYTSINEFTYGVGLGRTDDDFEKYFAGFTTMHGYQVNESFILGAGTGFLVYNGGTLLPLFLDFRYNIIVNQITPYFFANGGILFNFENFQSSKIYINPGIGARYPFSRKVAANAGAGILAQAGELRDSFVNFKLGLTYKF